MIYKICTAEDWAACERDGWLPWSSVDRRDGFVHLSGRHQVQSTADAHFHGCEGLVLLEVDPTRLPPGALRWEVSRGGDRFPHVYADLPVEAVNRAAPAPLGPDGRVRLPFGVGDESGPESGDESGDESGPE